ncbi:MAG: PAS domain S-box protein [Candidatus Scalindua sp.]|nr:PAS domain S-box protein [Candidatus Scalindua sp.]MBT5305574.1 PAS domain S-box protein [Candidatus Scalindua sp.]MBT6230401.1 PAS domain S-box protein [Candidatus Scalindua sp.]
MSTQPCILVVDDDIELCGNICEIIEKGGYKVESVHNGKEAIALSQKNKYDIILVDIELPDITGNKVVREISKTSSSTEFIYITGNATVDSAVEAVKNKQVISYETKPIDIDRFLILLGQITKRKKTEKALKQSEHRFKRYFDLGLIGMATTSLDKNWIEFNDTLCNMFGYLREDFAKLTWTELTHPEDLEFDIAQFNRVLTGEIEGYSIEKRFIHKNGSILYAVISANVLRKADGAVDHFIALVHDITKHKKMEKALMQSEKLKSIGTITAGISHEFNNILAIISGNVQLLKEDYEDHRELTEALCTIKRAVDDGAQISSQMLKFTKTETDAGGLVSSDIRDLIMQSIDFTLPRWRNEAQANGIDYQIDKDGMKSLSAIMCNPSELREVFINIIGNALDAMPEGGRLSFSTWSDDDTVFVGVSDTGEGMSEEVKKYIFDPFFTTKSQ